MPKKSNLTTFRIVALRNPCFSAMSHANSALITGSMIGELHFFKENALHFDKDFLIERLDLEKMCYSKSVPAHVSFVNQLEVHKAGYLFSSGIHDECVMQWRYVEEEPYWDLDYRDIDVSKPDLFNEVPPKDKFENLCEKVTSVCVKTYRILHRCCHFDMKLKNINKAWMSSINKRYPFHLVKQPIYRILKATS